MKTIKNGLLVILEGGEGVGKTTQAKKLVEYYQSKGFATKYFREPGGNKLAEDIRNMILYNEMDAMTETLLFTAARRINITENILPALKEGNIVILDRFVKSTVYQGVLKNGDMNFINTCIKEVTSDIFNNEINSVEITLLCDPEVAMGRAAAEGHERNKFDVAPIEQYKKINDAYYDLYEKYDYCNCRAICDADFTEEKVFNYLQFVIDDIIYGHGED